VNWSPEKRRQFLRDLNEVEKGIGTFYRYFLYALVIGVTLFGFYLYESFDKANRPFLEAYFGILYLLFLLWVGAQLLGLRGRVAGRDHRDPGPKFDMKFARDPDTGARKFSFQFGAPSASCKAAKFNFGFDLSSVADEDKLDDSAWAQAEGYLQAGTSLDMLCRLLNPRYGDWSQPQQEVYRAYVQAAVESRKAQNPQFAEDLRPSAVAPPAAEQSVQIPPAAATLPDVSSAARKSWLTSTQVTVVVIIAGILAGALITTLLLSRTLNQ